MEWLSLLLAAVLFAAACNLDTVILSMGYAVKGVRVSLSHSLIIAALTTLITWASLLLGAGAARVLSGPLPNLLGGLVLAGIGAEGETRVHNIKHIDRGYEDYCGKLSQLGANVSRRQVGAAE